VGDHFPYLENLEKSDINSVSGTRDTVVEISWQLSGHGKWCKATKAMISQSQPITLETEMCDFCIYDEFIQL